MSRVMSPSLQRAAALLVVLLLYAAAARAPPTPDPTPDDTTRCILAPFCLCHHEHFICNDVPFHQLPEIDEGVLHVAVSGARLDALVEWSLPPRALLTLQVHESALHELHPAALLASTLSLTSLDLAYNQLTELPLSALRPLRALHWLNLHNNHIGSLEGSLEWGGLVNTLTSLSLSNNELCVVEEGALSGLRRLARLDLQGNRIRALHPASLPPSLTALLLDGNLLSDAPCDPLPRLQYLRLRDNMLHVGPPSTTLCHTSRSRRLDTLDLAYNQLTAAELPSLLRDVTARHLVLDLNSLSALPPTVYEHSRLERLSATHNRITYLPPAALRHMRADLLRLELDHNRLTELPLALRDLARLRLLSLGYNNLREVHALPSHLRVLNLAGNYLNTWPTELVRLGVGELRRLDLGYNRLTSLDPTAWGPWASALETLDLRGNRLATLAVSPALSTSSPPTSLAGLPPLRELLLGFNDLYALPLGALDLLPRTLRVLELSSSQLGGEFPACAMLDHLEWLYLGDSDVSSVTSHDLALLPVLEFLNLEFNKLERFPSDDSPPPPESRSHLRELRLAYNHLREIQWRYLSALSELRSLDLGDNQVRAVPGEALVGLEHLRHLNLAANLLTHIAPRCFLHLPALRHLHLQGNLLTELSVGYFEDVGHPDGSLLLNASHNRISRLTGLEAGGGGPLWVTELDLSHNLICVFSRSFFESVASHLRYMDLSHNLLIQLELPFTALKSSSSLTHLEALLVHHNNISELRPLVAPALVVLDLGHNVVRTLPGGFVAGAPRLSRLVLGHNRVRALPRNALAGAALEYLDLSNNLVAVFPAGALAAAGRTLRRLDLAANTLEHLDAHMFSSLRSLTDLTLRDNTLTVLPDNTFASLPRLRRLDLARNAIKTNFKELFHNLPELRHVSLAGCGLRAVPRLPLRNLTALDLSDNYVSTWRDADLREMPALRVLHLARNHLTALRPGAWSAAPRLVALDLSDNPVLALTVGSFEHLTRLHRLRLAPLPQLEAVEERALSPLVALRVLVLDAPLGSGVVPGVLLRHVGHVEAVTLQVRDARLDRQLSGLGVHKLRAVELRGAALREVSAGALAALGEQRVLALHVSGTQVSALPAGLLAPLSRVPHLALELTDNRRLTELHPAVLYHNLTDWNRRATTLLPGGLVLSGNALRCGCTVSWLGGWLRRWAAETGGGAAAGAAGAARGAVCEQRGGGSLPLISLHTDPAECAASALSSRAAPLTPPLRHPLLALLLLLLLLLIVYR